MIVDYRYLKVGKEEVREDACACGGARGHTRQGARGKGAGLGVCVHGLWP